MCIRDRNNLKELLGTQQYSESIHSDRDQVGVVNGLAWTQVGGEILEVEALSLIHISTT